MHFLSQINFSDNIDYLIASTNPAINPVRYMLDGNFKD